MICLEENNFSNLFKIEKSSLSNKPIDKPLILLGDKTPHQTSRASYLHLIGHYKKMEKNNTGASSKDIRIMKEEANVKGYTCPHCKSHFHDYASVDHFIPRYFGGENSFSNLNITCSSCNYSKGALNPEHTPYAFKKFQKKRLEKSASDCLAIIEECLLERELIEEDELTKLFRLREKEISWRLERDCKKAA